MNPVQRIKIESTALGDSVVSSPTLKQSNSPFLTDKDLPTPNELDIKEKHQQLNKYIDQLDRKIQSLIQHNEAEVLFAYRNHFAKVRKEIEQFKEETLEQVRSEADLVGRISLMERQLVVFREEALRLFAALIDKNKVIDLLRLRLEELQVEKKYMDLRVKEMMKDNKEMKVRANTIQSASEQNDSQIQSKNREEFGKTFYSLGVHSYKKNMQRDRKIKDRTFTTSKCDNTQTHEQTSAINQIRSNISTPIKNCLNDRDEFKAIQIGQIVRNKYSHLQPDLLDDLVKTIQDSVQQKQSGIYLRTIKIQNCSNIKKNSNARKSSHFVRSASEQKSKNRLSSVVFRDENKTCTSFSKTNELGEYFRRCIETVKREVASRTKKAAARFFTGESTISLQDFKKIDFLRLMELVFADDRVSKMLYEAVIGVQRTSVFSYL